ncbi:TPA: DUF3800 domain-containing protein [Enterococcus faecalis]
MAKVKKRYDLFYDEAFHDRKLTEKETEHGELNIENNEQGENFIAVTIGFRTYQTQEFFTKFLVFENNTKKLLGLQSTQEFKGTTIKKKNFKYGIRSFNKDALKIYSEYFDLFDKNTIITISSLNKFELIVLYLIQNAQLPPYVIIKNFVYSLIKFLDHYKNKELISIFFDKESTTEKILDTIISMFNEVLIFIKGVTRKDREESAIQQMKFIIENSQFEMKTLSEYNWDYSRAIDGIVFLLNELKIKKTSVTLYIDNEEKTVSVAKKYGFKKVESVDSKESVGVRISDILSNFIGRVLKAIDDEYLEDWDNEETKINIHKRRILSSEWFDLNQEQFLLYQKIANIFYYRKDIYWTVKTGIYAGKTSIFFTLIYYIGIEFTNYQEYKEVSLEDHRENFNIRSLEREENIFYSK